ncbi:protein shisa-5-like isoform X2 [Bacillus rossius redtenbacheri]|uniref:protein shisa-5-like isoform X2 n=1 Tax=Bacillus rossius redtenbacheri TaxID=93214 RepID=UPI002FDDFA55
MLKMINFCGIVFLLVAALHCEAAMDCPFSNGNQYTAQLGLSSATQCPLVLGDPDDRFCCLNDRGAYYCCDLDEFENNLGAGIVIAIAVGTIAIISVLLCLCCCCCPCCCLYKRRHRGTVYGTGVHTTVVHVPQPVVVPTHAAVQHAGAVPSAQPHTGFYPPTYDEATAKQAPYNPNY